MNNIHDLLVSRRSIRRFKSEPIPAEDIKLILEAGLISPTSKSGRPWEFVAVDDPDMLRRLSECKASYANAVAGCQLAIVITVDSTKSEAWIEDASVAASFMMMQAQDLGLGSCWVQVRGRFAADGTPSEEYVQELLQIPEVCTPVCILALGYPDEQRKPQDLEKLKWNQVHFEKF